MHVTSCSSLVIPCKKLAVLPAWLVLFHDLTSACLHVLQDKRDAADAAKPLNLTVIPPPEELVDQPLDRVKKFFSNAFSQ